ncbi:hypothetical protein B0H19DRAFT_1330294 [Mycena capillaripes]|nr:hypothetical protein B0H19DRAFT_1330294 [Mycena capillaripes]
MNWIHSHYKISNNDFLYTMSVFIFQPAKSCTYVERCFFILWAEIGQRMSITNSRRPRRMEPNSNIWFLRKRAESWRKWQ